MAFVFPSHHYAGWERPNTRNHRLEQKSLGWRGPLKIIESNLPKNTQRPTNARVANTTPADGKQQRTTNPRVGFARAGGFTRAPSTGVISTREFPRFYLSPFSPPSCRGGARQRLDGG